MTRILAVDPGDVRIGLALSDPSGTIARPLTVLVHKSRAKDAAMILQIAAEQAVELILIGVPFDAQGEVGPQARKALRLVAAIEALGEIPVETWDESGSTQTAQRFNRRRDAHIDATAAAVILQDYLDAKKP
jgi:putative Holliday junction resolvase